MSAGKTRNPHYFYRSALAPEYWSLNASLSPIHLTLHCHLNDLQNQQFFFYGPVFDPEKIPAPARGIYITASPEERGWINWLEPIKGITKSAFYHLIEKFVQQVNAETSDTSSLLVPFINT